MSTRRCWRSLCLTSKSIASTSLSEGSLAATPNNYDYWRHGCSSKRPKKSSWNRRPNIGDQCGKRWKGIGNRYARREQAQGGSLEPCIWRRRYPIVDDEDARGIFLTPNVW